MNEQKRKQLIDERRKSVNKDSVKAKKIKSDERRYQYALENKRTSQEKKE